MRATERFPSRLRALLVHIVPSISLSTSAHDNKLFSLSLLYHCSQFLTSKPNLCLLYDFRLINAPRLREPQRSKPTH